MLAATDTEKLDAITAALDEHCAQWLTYERPKGGLYVWVTLKDGVGFEANDVQLEAIARGLNVQDGTQYYLPPYVDGAKGAERPADLSHLRLCFAGQTPELLHEAGRRLGEALAAAEVRF